MNYRKIWITANGPIPKDSDGRTYEIHHKDGNRENNDLDNLMCLSIQEHYDIHLAQKDYQACHAIKLRMKYSHKEISELASKAAKARKVQVFNIPEVRAKNIASIKSKIENGTFHLLSGEIQRKSNLNRVVLGIHNFQQAEHITKVKERNTAAIKEGTHVFCGGEMQSETQSKRVKDGSHHFLSEDHKKRTSAKTLEMVKNGTHPAQKEITCDFCGYIGKGPGFYLKHNERCKSNPNRIQLNCPYCDKRDLSPSTYKRWHGDNCKSRFND